MYPSAASSATTAEPTTAGAIEQRPIRPEIQGAECRLADGRAWLLAFPGLAPAFDEVRDRMYERSVAAGSVLMEHVRTAAFLCLLANYRLTHEEAAALVFGADEDDLVAGVKEALWPSDNAAKTYTAWARGALIANGIRPESVEGTDLVHVLAHLVQTGRAVGIDDYCECHRYAATRKALLALAGAGA